jgi:hypothetical protein
MQKVIKVYRRRTRYYTVEGLWIFQCGLRALAPAGRASKKVSLVVGPSIISLDNLLSDNRLDVNRAEGIVIEDFGIRKRTTCVAVVPVIGANCREVESRTVVKVSVFYACRCQSV